MRVCVVDSPESAGRRVAERIVTGLGAKQPFVLGAPAGRTPLTTYRALADSGADLSGLTVAMMDEYVVDGRRCDESAHYSCRRFAREALAGAGSIHFPDPANPSAYDAWLGSADLFLIASGASDGHVGFNPPGTTLDSPARVVELAESTRRDNLLTFPDFRELAEVPRQGVTVGLRAMVAAEESILLLLGAGKRESFRRVTAAAAYDPEWPATVIHACRNGWILADQEAAG